MLQRLTHGEGHALNRNIWRGAATTATLQLLVKFLAMGKDLIVAGTLGAGDEMDAYLLAYALPTLLINVMGQAFGFALLPVYVQVRDVQGSSASRVFAGSVVACAAVLLAMVAGLLVALSSPITPLIDAGSSPARAALTTQLFWLLAPTLAISGLSAVFASLLQANHRMAITGLAPAALPLGMLAVFVPWGGRWGAYALAWGTIAGSSLELAFLVAATVRMSLIGKPAFVQSRDSLLRVWRSYVPVFGGSILLSSCLVVDQSMAAPLGSGSVSALNYGNKLIALLLGIAGVSLTTAVFPHFARLAAGRHYRLLRQTFFTQGAVVVGVSIPLAVILATFARPMIALLFERGAFTSESTAEAAQVQACFALQTPFYILSLIGTRLVSALGGNRLIFRIGAVSLAINVLGNYVLRQWLGVAGIALSTSLMYAVSCAAVCYSAELLLRRAESEHDGEQP